MRTLESGSRGAQVQLLQLALRRWGATQLPSGGYFGTATREALKNFQRRVGLKPDGIAGAYSHRALEPYYTGYVRHRVRAGDTLYSLALRYGSSIQMITTANPGLEPAGLREGQHVNVPLNFPLVPTDIDWCSELVDFCCRGLAARYPFIAHNTAGESVMGKPLHELRLGTGERRVFYSAQHHANEWITTPLLLRMTEQLAQAAVRDGRFFGMSARELLRGCTLSIVPAVNPDGMDLVTGELNSREYYTAAEEIARDYPDIPFPQGWKANIAGVDLNLQYPAQWELAKEIKFAQGYTGPAPRDYVGAAALSEPESAAVYRHCLLFDPDIVVAWHTQGSVIYWKYADFEPEGSRKLAEAFGDASGYTVEETPYNSGFAGFKDWFIQNYNRPGYTIEAGMGINPLPLSQFDEIYRDNIGIMAIGMAEAGNLD